MAPGACRSAEGGGKGLQAEAAALAGWAAGLGGPAGLLAPRERAAGVARIAAAAHGVSLVWCVGAVVDVV